MVCTIIFVGHIHDFKTEKQHYFAGYPLYHTVTCVCYADLSTQLLLKLAKDFDNKQLLCDSTFHTKYTYQPAYSMLLQLFPEV